MSWDHDFISALERGDPRRRFTMESIGGAAFVQGSSSVWLSTHQESSQHLPIIARSGHSLRAGSLQPGEWSTTQSELTLRLTKGWSYGLSGAARGQLYQLRMGFQGWGQGKFQPIFTGRLVNVRRGSAGDWFVDLRSAAGLLVSRATMEGLQTGLFYDLPQRATSLAADLRTGHTTLQVNDATGAHTEIGAGRYLVEVQPNDGAPYLVECSALSGTTFTISGVLFGGTQLDADKGNTVRILAYVRDHPIDAVKKFVTSTGNANNGPYDTLPAAWGLGLPWECINFDDMDVAKNTLNGGTFPVSGNWKIYSADPADDGLSWLQNMLNPAGLFITEAEGQLTVRPATNSSGQQLEVQWIDDREIVSIGDHNEFDPSAVVEYSRHKLTTPSGEAFQVEYLASLPGAKERAGELPFIEASEIQWRLNILERVTGWSTRIPESISLVLAGHKRARLAPGSGLGIRSRLLDSRIGVQYPDDVWMVTSCEPDWFGSSTRITASRIPHVEDAP